LTFCKAKMIDDLRKALLKFIGAFAGWDHSTNRTYIDVSRALVRAAHGDEPPLIVDPFAGGGSIPLEALRLGCEAFASDLNPVACLILKVMLEDVPRDGLKLGEELRRRGADLQREAERTFCPLEDEPIRTAQYAGLARFVPTRSHSTRRRRGW
jgi:adenine-specific DNA methylase